MRLDDTEKRHLISGVAQDLLALILVLALWFMQGDLSGLIGPIGFAIYGFGLAGGMELGRFVELRRAKIRAAAGAALLR